MLRQVWEQFYRTWSVCQPAASALVHEEVCGWAICHLPLLSSGTSSSKREVRWRNQEPISAAWDWPTASVSTSHYIHTIRSILFGEAWLSMAGIIGQSTMCDGCIPLNTKGIIVQSLWGVAWLSSEKKASEWSLYRDFYSMKMYSVSLSKGQICKFQMIPSMSYCLLFLVPPLWPNKNSQWRALPILKES